MPDQPAPGQSGISAWFQRTFVDLAQQVRWSFLPPLMVYVAAGVSGLTGIVGTFFVKDYLGLSAELRQSVTENIEIVGFADWGYIGAEEFPDFSGESHAGAGLGLRYDTGIGPIRLDVATPISGNTPASSYYLYLGIGQAF